MSQDPTSHRRLILASQSKIRRELLSNAGIDFETMTSHVDEVAAKNAMRSDGVSLSDQAVILAEMKALRISQTMQGIVIGADQILDLDGKGFDKPSTRHEAKERLLELSGRSHYLQTAVVGCIEGRVVWKHLVRPRLTMRRLTAQFIDDFVEAEGDDILASVGAYQVEKTGIHLFERIEGDYFSILGLPLLPLLAWLREIGAVRT
jgi:septum formation protein